MWYAAVISLGEARVWPTSGHAAQAQFIPRGDALPATGVTPDVVSWTWGYVRQICFPQHQQQQQQPYSRAGLAAGRPFGMSGDFFRFD